MNDTDYLRDAAARLAQQKEVWLAAQINSLGLTPERAAELFWIEESGPRLEINPNTGAHTLCIDLRLCPRKLS